MSPVATPEVKEFSIGREAALGFSSGREPWVSRHGQ